jgi:GNAT superfamily N-acetyltransferase
MPESRELIRTLMTEAEQVAAQLGIRLRRTVEERMAGAEQVGEHRTSMLQDLEKGDRLEIDALVTAVLEMGRLSGAPTPSIQVIEACLRLLERTRRSDVHGADSVSLDGEALQSLAGPRTDSITSLASEANRVPVQSRDPIRPTGPADQVRIRPMEPGDVPASMAILGAWDMAPTPERKDAERSGILVENAFVAEYQGRIVGTAGWFPLSESVAETASLAVERGCRGLGVGRLLQDARLEAMRAKGFRKVRTETDRPETIRWYKDKFGYREVGKNPKKHPFSLPDVDEWTVLELDL